MNTRALLASPLRAAENKQAELRDGDSVSDHRCLDVNLAPDAQYNRPLGSL
jgi:hypothetical protein